MYVCDDISACRRRVCMCVMKEESVYDDISVCRRRVCMCVSSVMQFVRMW